MDRTSRKPSLSLVLSVIAGLIAVFVPSANAQPAAVCTPTIDGPIAVTADSKPYERVAIPQAGAVEEEFFVSCDVKAGHYKTLIHVRLPKAPVQQSGIVIAEPWHGGNLWTLYAKTSEYDARAGHVAVIIVGSPRVLDNSIKKSNPSRYASLTLPAGAQIKTGTSTQDATELEVLGQVGLLIKKGGIPGVKARKVILGGMSQTGGVTRAYITYEHSGAGAKSVYDGYFPMQSAVSSYATSIPDLDVPVVEVQGERELIDVRVRAGADHIIYRRPDGALYRLYEVAGMPHVQTRGRGEDNVGDYGCKGRTLSDYPLFYVYAASLDNLIGWVDKGVPAPHVSWIETNQNGSEIKRDSFGNALGGYRLSYVDVPIATYHSTWADYVMTPNGPSDPEAARCDRIGWMTPLPPEQLKKLYPTHEDYVRKVNDSLKSLVAARLLLFEDAKALADEASAARVPGP